MPRLLAAGLGVEVDPNDVAAIGNVVFLLSDHVASLPTSGPYLPRRWTTKTL